MFALRIGLMAVLVAALTGLACRAETLRDGARHLTYDKNKDFAPFESKPARELMTPKEFEDYDRALKEWDCAAANRVLNKAFVRHYPLFKDALMVSQCRRSPHCHHWRMYSQSQFREYGFCVTMTGFRKAEDEIRRQRIPQQKFRMKAGWREETVYDNTSVEARDHNINVLISKARLSYRPALVKLAELVRRGDLFNAGEDVEYYLRKRACIVGEHCRQPDQRMEELRTHIGAKRVAAIDKMAEAEIAARPNLHKMLLGEAF